MTPIASAIDHTLLKPEATITEITQLCMEAREHGFHSVCVNGYWLANCRALLAGTDVKLCSVVDFPLGASLSRAKADETRDLVAAGADEIDVVINIGAAREGHWDFLEHELHEIVSAGDGRVTKAILEICYLTDEEIVQACKHAKAARIDFVKTSTGFGPAGATVEAVKLMRETVGPDMGVKASGGIRDRATAEAMLAAGATRLGTSASVAIVTG